MNRRFTVLLAICRESRKVEWIYEAMESCGWHKSCCQILKNWVQPRQNQPNIYLLYKNYEPLPLLGNINWFFVLRSRIMLKSCKLLLRRGCVLCLGQPSIDERYWGLIILLQYIRIFSKNGENNQATDMCKEPWGFVNPQQRACCWSLFLIAPQCCNTTAGMPQRQNNNLTFFSLSPCLYNRKQYSL